MADQLGVGGVETLPLRRYGDIRHELRPGDLFFASGRYPFSLLIQAATKSPWSHVGFVLPVPAIDRVLLLESVEDIGVRLVPLSKYLTDYDNAGAPYDGPIAVARPRGLTDRAVKELARFGTSELARPYDKDAVAAIAARIALGVGREGPHRRAYVCSELVQACFAHAGYVFRGGTVGFVSPRDVWADDRVELVARIK
jgi:hypothetical protein